MFYFVYLVACLGYVFQAYSYDLPNGGQIKAVLVAGSNGYENYRHQADVCHAYQLLIKNKIPRENIIVMMYDDIANNTDNPEPGVIINVPNGPNVYNGVQIDYSGEAVNKKNLFNVLNGNKEGVKGIGSGRVLESGPNDNIFFNFVDHGGPGELLMPAEEIQARELISTLENMYTKKRFAKMFVYIEACESGSIFDNLLPDDLNIFVMTAADPIESSYACFYDTKLGTYLADVFSVNWMKNSESENLSNETVNHQFQKVRHATNTSHVEEYGDIDIGNTKMSEVNGVNQATYPKPADNLNFQDAVPNNHVPIAILGQKIARAKQPEEKQKLKEQLHKLIQGRKKIEQLFVSLVREVGKASSVVEYSLDKMLLKHASLTKSNVQCYENIKKQIGRECISVVENPYVASHLHKIINLCNAVPESIVHTKISELCEGKEKLRGIV